MNPPGKWLKTKPDGKEVFACSGYAVYGWVKATNYGWSWEAKVLLSCADGSPLRGHAPALSNAKKIVETLLIETGTVQRE